MKHTLIRFRAEDEGHAGNGKEPKPAIGCELQLFIQQVGRWQVSQQLALAFLLEVSVSFFLSLINFRSVDIPL